jgi:hypothetical protein
MKAANEDYLFSDELKGLKIKSTKFTSKELELHFTDGRSLLLRVTKMADGKHLLVPFTVMGNW